MLTHTQARRGLNLFLRAGKGTFSVTDESKDYFFKSRN